MSIEFGSRPGAELHGPDDNLWFKALMHFGVYLMIAALAIMGVEVAYALYQLAAYFL